MMVLTGVTVGTVIATAPPSKESGLPPPVSPPPVKLTEEKGEQPDFERSPFQAVRWAPEVEVDGRWYQLRSVDGVPVQDIISFIRPQEGDKWPRRFTEDLVEILSKMDKPIGPTVKLVVIDSATGQEKTLDKVPASHKNREAIIREKFEQKSLPKSMLKPQHLNSALDAFVSALDNRWSYRSASGADFDTAVAALRQKIGAGISADEFGIELQKIIALGIDGHASISGYQMPGGHYLPFLVEPEDKQFVAFKPDRSGFLADGFPYVTKIDGKDVGAWCGAAAAHVPKGSPQYVRHHCLRLLRHVDYLRQQLKLPKKDIVEVELAAKDGTKRKTISLATSTSYPAYGEWPRDGSQILKGNVGYLRLKDMTSETSVPDIKKWMEKFRNTAGLIVDVRDNGGGNRDALVWLYSYLASPDATPRVVTAAAYRLCPEHQVGHLAKRFMYPADAKQWAPAERQAIATFAKTFQPQWELPKGQFSDWHYLVLSRRDSPEIYHYDKPVVVLMSAKCFSATDIFLAGLKGMRNLTCLGTASGGGSSFVQDVQLGLTPFHLRIGSMVSYQSDGKLFDGVGVQPDVKIDAIPEYYIGGRDNVLEDAIQRVKNR